MILLGGCQIVSPMRAIHFTAGDCWCPTKDQSTGEKNDYLVSEVAGYRFGFERQSWHPSFEERAQESKMHGAHATR